jgi:DNA-binding transcriptional LysR family regulator
VSDLVSLKLFVRAAECGSLSEAARLSNLAIAAASRRIANLEHRYRVQLFQRSRQGMALTPAGQAFLASARAVLDQTQAMDAEMADFAGGVRGTIRVHVNPSAIIQFLPADLAAFANARPDIRLDLAEHVSGHIVENILGERADLGIIIGGTPTYQLETLPYRHDRLALLAPRGTLEGRTEIPFSEVQDQDFVGLLQTTSLTQTLIAEAAKADLKLKLRMQVRSFDGVCRMIEAGFGLGVLPEIAARGFARSMRLDVVPLADDWARRSMQICVAPGGLASRIARSLAEHLTTCASGECTATPRFDL